MQLHTTRASFLHISIIQFTNGIVLAALFLLFSPPRRSAYLLVPLALLSFYLTDFLGQFGGMPSAGAYSALVSTSIPELTGYLQIKAPALLTYLGATAIFAYLLTRVLREVEIKSAQRKRALTVLLLILALIFNGVFLPSYLNRTRWVGYRLALQNSFPLGFLTCAIESTYFLANHRIDNARFQFHATRSAPVRDREVVVLVIGESSSAAFWSMDGYSHPTNPELQRFQDAGSLLNFPYTLAQANATQFAVPMIVTAATPRTFDKAFHEKSIVTAFKETGFATYWISNQDESPYAGEADLFQPLDQIQSGTQHSFDEDLWPALDSILASRNQKMFIVLHLIGSHTPYPDRVPPAFQFQDFTIKSLLERQYARTIAYTDHVLDGILRRLDRSEGRVFLWFVSDHGQVLRAGDVGHGGLDPSVNELHVPMFFWGNTAFRAGASARIEALQQRRNDLLSQGVTFPTILGLAGLSYPGMDRGRDLSSEAFDPARETEVFSAAGEVTGPRKVEEERKALMATRPKGMALVPFTQP